MVPIMISFKEGSANREVIEPRVSSGQVEFFNSKVTWLCIVIISEEISNNI